MHERHSIVERCLWLAALAGLVFFGRWWVSGLQPDAALYAGLSSKILRTREMWLLEGSENRFPIYFEHPPFFYQWGSVVLKFFGESDGAARAMGGIPGCIAFLSMLIWTWARLGWLTAAMTALMLATFGHYTKFAATAMMEGPLSLGVCWTAIAAFELHWREKAGLKRPFFWAVLFVGLAIAGASKGIVGLGAWGALGLSLIFALLFSEREPVKVLFSILFMSVALLAVLAPLAYWGREMWNLGAGGFEYIVGYFQSQVFRSMTTNRGESFHSEAGDKLYYLKVLMKDGWPWWWTFVGGWIALILSPILRFRFLNLFYALDSTYKAWALNSLAFFVSFIVPFSLVKYQLPHYLHPVYLVAMPVGAGFLVRILPRLRFFSSLWNARVRWALLLVAGVAMFCTQRGLSTTQNRGQEFISAQEKLSKLDPDCEVVVPRDEIDVYKMECYALWYWKGRSWSFVDQKLPSKIATPTDKVYWEPSSGTLWGVGTCTL